MIKQSKQDKPKEESQIARPTTALLISEYRLLLASQMYTRLANRITLTVLILSQFMVVPRSNWMHFIIGTVGLLVSAWWLLHEKSAAHRIRRIGQLVVQIDNDEKSVQGFIEWRHELWKESRYGFLDTAEPLIWFAVVLVAAIVPVVFL